MAEPTFSRAAGQILFFLPLTGVPSGYTIAFLPNSNPGTDSLTLSATWTTNPGVYLFLGAPVADQPNFVAQVRNFTAGRGTRLLWIVNPASAMSQWVTNEIDLDTANAVLPTAQLAFRNFILSIGSGSPVALNATDDALTITAAGAAAIDFLTGFGAGSLATTNTATVSFLDAAAGTIAFTLPLTQSDFDQLDAGCRYFFDDPASPVKGMLTSLQYPIITLGSSSISLYAALDPVNPLVPARSSLTFLQSPASSGTALASAFRSVYGETITLTPVVSGTWPNGPALVFAVDTQQTTPSNADPYYTTFEGPFTTAVQNASPADTPIARMMCGFSGIEYAGLPAAQTNTIAFTSGQPAYAPVVRWTDVVIDAAPVTNAVPLTSVATTSWAMLSTSGATAMDYFAQPHDSVLYQATQTLAADDEEFLYYLEVFAGTFPTAPARWQCVPMVPYALIDTALTGPATDLETQVISPYRRNLLAPILGPTETGGDTGSVPAATPQGLLVTLSTNLGYWKTATFAQSNSGTEKLQFATITGGFKSALQSNQLFAVVSNVDELLRCCSVVPPFRLTVSDWTFDLSPSLWSQHDTIMILKYAAGTVDELTADSGGWCWPAAANGYTDTSGNTATTQADVRRIIEEAKAASLIRHEVQPFVDLISNPTWNGILFLRAPLSATSFPDQLRGLAAGIDPARLYAHHVGVSLAPVHNISGTLQQEDSSIFGLVDYQDRADLTHSGRDYDYKVLGLTVLFRNSTMTSFSSQIELMINKLFGSITSRRSDGGHGNNIILEGFYQSAGGMPAYRFLMTETSVYAIGGGTLDSIDITRAQFVTLSPTSSGQLFVETRFILDGRLRFRKIDDFDVFSFGPSIAPDGAVISDGYLVFSNLLIEMSFPLANPPDMTFRFNAASMALAPTQSVARAGSLFRHFPLQLTALIQAPPGTKPGDYGFATMTVPMRQAEMTDPWFALSFDLTIGTLGALPGDLGLVVSLGACWADSANSFRNYIGLKLPGSSGSRTAISIEGVVQLTFRAIEFSGTPSAQGIDYILRFRGITLRIFTLSFPPGQIDLYVFGNPSGGDSESIGWYFAYSKKDDKKKTGGSGVASLRSLHTLPEPRRVTAKRTPRARVQRSKSNQ
ncbi:MAG: hypothetical protein ABIQ65_15530 [Thermoanaerobaculia bacterium]